MDKKKKYETGIFIGKFYPFHIGHYNGIHTLLDECETIYLVFYNNENISNNSLFKYPIENRIQDTKELLQGLNVECVNYKANPKYIFPDDYRKIKNELFKQINVERIDIQLIGEDEEELYSKYIYADNYICSKNLKIKYKNEIRNLHASLIRNDYENMKKYLFENEIRTIDCLNNT